MPKLRCAYTQNHVMGIEHSQPEAPMHLVGRLDCESESAVFVLAIGKCK